MIVIPAIDLKGGRCVRLFQGDMDKETVFSESPDKVASMWQSKGARLIHVVDLDGAVRKSPQNVEAIKTILANVRTPVQLGGGVRDLATIDFYLELGVERIILGTVAQENPDLLKEACSRRQGAIIAGIDARGEKVAVDGWTRETEETPLDLARKMEDAGAAAIIYTDISRDGMRTGPNLENTARMCRAVSIPVICAGGVTTLEDIKNLLWLGEPNLWGAITGRAIYEGTLDLEQAIKLTEQSV